MKRLSWLMTIVAMFGSLSAACSGDSFASTDAATPQDSGASDATDGSSVDGGVADDAGLPRLGCGTSTCKLGETCCLYTSSGSGPQYECHFNCPAPQGGAQLSELRCNGAADCNLGQVCCIHRNGGMNQSSCSLTPCTGNDVQLCDPSAQDPGCPPSASCSSNNIADWNLPDTFGTCGGRQVP